MLLRKQNSGTVYATRSSEGKSLRASPSNLLVTPTQRLLFRGRQPTKSKWEPPGGAGATLRQRKTPTVQSQAYRGWKSALMPTGPIKQARLSAMGRDLLNRPALVPWVGQSTSPESDGKAGGSTIPPQLAARYYGCRSVLSR